MHPAPENLAPLHTTTGPNSCVVPSTHTSPKQSKTHIQFKRMNLGLQTLLPSGGRSGGGDNNEENDVLHVGVREGFGWPRAANFDTQWIDAPLHDLP